MLKFKNITLKNEEKYILKDFNLEIAKNSKTLLYGRSGIGKTSVYRLLLGFTQPDKGTINYKDRVLTSKIIHEIRSSFAYVPQNPDIGNGIIKEIFLRVFSFKANSNVNFSQPKIKELMEFFNLPANTLNENIEKLSGGEKQRVALILAISLNRSVFLLDEVTASLDKEMKIKVVDYFLSQKDWTVISISHDDCWLNHPEINVIEMEKKLWV